MKLPSFARPTTPAERLRLVLIVVGALVLLVNAVLIGISAWSSSPAVCSGCHEVAPSVDSWRTSAHAHVGCPACHEPVRAWYEVPASLAFRAQMYQHDLAVHNAKPDASALPTTGPPIKPIKDDNCLQCHDLSREVTLPPGLLMDHAKHVERNRSCVSCHRYVGHPPSDVEAPLLLMEQCFNCHGKQPGAKAPATCTLCHPVTFSARPQTHEPASAWLGKHGAAAKGNQQPCAMCHEKTFCTNCHGMDMPHPANWAKGRPPAHAQFAKTNVQVCVQCHGPEKSLCSMCHHKGDYNPTRGTWVQEHRFTVDQRGTAFCLSCHDSVFCTDCHAKRQDGSSNTLIKP